MEKKGGGGMNTQLDNLIRNMDENLAPSLETIPDDFLKYSIPVADLKVQYTPLLGLAIRAWIKAVKPAVTLKYSGGDLIHTLDTAIRELRKYQVDATAIVGNPMQISDLSYAIPLRFRNDDEWIGDAQLEILGAKWEAHVAIDYSDGLYLFDDRAAKLYIAGISYAYWGNRPVIAHVVKEK